LDVLPDPLSWLCPLAINNPSARLSALHPYINFCYSFVIKASLTTLSYYPYYGITKIILDGGKEVNKIMT